MALSWALSIFSQPCSGVFMAVLGRLIQGNPLRRCPKRIITQTTALSKQRFWLNWGLEVCKGHNAHCPLVCFLTARWADNFGIVLSPVILLLCRTGSGTWGSKPYALSHKKPGKLNYTNASWAVSASNAGFFFSKAIKTSKAQQLQEMERALCKFVFFLYLFYHLWQSNRISPNSCFIVNFMLLVQKDCNVYVIIRVSVDLICFYFIYVVFILSSSSSSCFINRSFGTSCKQ